MTINRDLIEKFYSGLDSRSREALDRSAERIIQVKRQGGKIVVASGSGPNLHEGVTTLVAELMDKGIVDGVTTSSAVIGHEMAGCLDRVRMCDASLLGLPKDKMPRGNVFEFTDMTEAGLAHLRREMVLDEELLSRGRSIPGREVIKAAGNMAYPMGLRNEMLSEEILEIARELGLPFETVAGWGADRRTIIGIGAEKGLPVIVSIPQMVGGGSVGMAIGESIPISNRSMRLAKMMEEADVILESAIALSQEIHDGPFENYTGHGIWAWWKGRHTYSLRGKTIIRIDLDQNLREAQDQQKKDGRIQEAIAKGLPKTKISGIPFRMEMSAFARHEGSIPIIGDIGEVWPVLALRVSDALGIKLDFMSYKQETDDGKAMREWIVREIKPLDPSRMRKKAAEWR